MTVVPADHVVFRPADADGAEVDDGDGVGGPLTGTAATARQRRGGVTQADDDGDVQRQNDDERQHGVGGQLDELESAVHELGRQAHLRRATRFRPHQRTVVVSHCKHHPRSRRHLFLVSVIEVTVGCFVSNLAVRLIIILFSHMTLFYLLYSCCDVST